MVDLQQVPSTSTAVPAPLHTPQESRVPSGQHHPAPSRALPSSQQVTFLSSTPDGQHCCCASTTPLLQFAATCANATHAPYSGMCYIMVSAHDIDTYTQLWLGVSNLDGILDGRHDAGHYCLHCCYILCAGACTHTQTHTRTKGVRCGQVPWVTAMQARMLITLRCNTALNC